MADDTRDDDPVYGLEGVAPSDVEIREGLEGRRLRAVLRQRMFGTQTEAVRLGPYRVCAKLGQGGMGSVYEAEHEDTAQRVAVKVVRSADGAVEARLAREGRAMARLSHDNLVSVIAVDRCEHGLYVAMELVSGTTLRAWASTEPRTVAEIVAVLADAADGLAAAHDAGVMHRDVKPENILVDERGQARVTDFGLAKPVPGSPAEAMSTFAATLTPSGASPGTLSYMAPEQLLGKPVTPAVDQFALGATAFETLYARPPFWGATGDAVAMAIVEGDVTPPPDGEIRDARVHAVVLRALSAEPSARFESMAAMANALREALDPAEAKSGWRRLFRR